MMLWLCVKLPCKLAVVNAPWVVKVVLVKLAVPFVFLVLDCQRQLPQSFTSMNCCVVCAKLLFGLQCDVAGTVQRGMVGHDGRCTYGDVFAGPNGGFITG